MTSEPITKEKRLETLAVLAGFCVIVALIKLSKGGSPQVVAWWLEGGIAFLVVGLFIAPLANLIARLWLRLSHLMGAVMSRVLMGLIFLLVLLPLAMLRRVFTRQDELQLKRKIGGGSYYSEEAKTYTAQDLQFPW